MQQHTYNHVPKRSAERWLLDRTLEVASRRVSHERYQKTDKDRKRYKAAKHQHRKRLIDLGYDPRKVINPL